MNRILLAEADENFRKNLAWSLSRAGYEVVQASNGRAALELLRHTAPSLVVTSVFLPDRDGLEVIREVRAQLPGVPVVALSASCKRCGYDAFDIALRLGADRVLEKPVTSQALLKALMSLPFRQRQAGSGSVETTQRKDVA
ncbi:response regulator transcription factor [Fodinicurvata halophila]|uniref:Response regulator transcription factor n=1 Tax=Fodinicurvata halophila TaxID=1419723 RepID=A0ABV8UJ92_9PROT